MYTSFDKTYKGCASLASENLEKSYADMKQITMSTPFMNIKKQKTLLLYINKYNFTSPSKQF